MEKKRSPRSSRSPGIFPKSPLVYETYKSGCAWKLINFFNFKHIRSDNKKLGSEKKFIRDSAGNVYTKSQLDLLKKLHEKCQCNERIGEEEMSRKSKTRRRSLGCERELEKSESKPVQGLLEREIERIKNLKEENCNNLSDQKHYPLSEIENSEKRNDKGKQMSLKNSEINLQVRMNEAAETLMSSNAEEKGKILGSNQSKQFMEALDILSSNKDLFITLLQDPKSFSEVKESRAKSPSKLAGSLRESDDYDDIVLLKPSLSTSGDDRAYMRFKHLAKKLKLVVGSNKDCNYTEKKPEGSSREAEAAFRTGSCDVSTSTVSYRSPESPVFRRKKRVESDVFKLGLQNDVMPRRFMVERLQERSNSSPVYEVPQALSSLQTKLKERRQKLENKRQSFKLWSLDKNFEVFDPKPLNYNLKSFQEDSCRGSADYRSLRTRVEDECVEDRYLENSFAESSCSESQTTTLETKTTLFSDVSSPERRDSSFQNPKQDQDQEQEQPSPVSVLQRIHLEDDTVSPGNVKLPKLEEQTRLSFNDLNIDVSFFEKESVYEFVKKVLEASRLNWTNLMARCSEETSLLDEFSHGHNNNDQLLLLDYTDEILREIYRQDLKFWPLTPLKSSRVVNPPSSLRKDLIQEAMRRFDWSLLCCDSLDSNVSRTLNELIEMDLMKPCLWLDFGGESEGIVSEIVEKVLLQLVFELSGELRIMQQRRISGLSSRILL